MGWKILLIVDEDDRTMQLSECRFGSQYHVVRVSHGRRAIRLAEKKGVALLIISQYLPDMDGLDVLRNLQKRSPSTPAIFVGKELTKGYIISAFRLGAKDVLEKPLDEHTFVESINRVLVADEKDRIQPALGARYPPASGVQRTSVGLFKNRNILSSSWLKSLARTFKPSDFRARVKDRETKEITPRGIEKVTQENLPPRLRVYCLGRFKVVLRDQVIESWPSRKGKAIFAYLAYNHKQRIYRDVLIDKFWPSSSADSARNCLNVTLHGIRRLFHETDLVHEYILFKDECYFINPEVEIWLDVEEFLQHWRAGQSLERQQSPEAAVVEYEFALANYLGDFMGEDPYEAWPSLERENLKEIYLLVLDRLSRYYSLDGKSETAIDLCELILANDSCREDVHQRLMRCYYRIGQRDKALKQFRKCAEILRAELEVEPTRETNELYELVKRDGRVPGKKTDVHI